MEMAQGQFTPEGTWWWDGKVWRPVLSKDGAYRWSGSAWVALKSRPPLINVPLDEYVRNVRNSRARKRPSDPLTHSFDFLVGSGWVAGRAIYRWHVVEFAKLEAIAIVAPKAIRKLIAGGSGVTAAVPNLHFVENDGHGLIVGANRISTESRWAIFNQIAQRGILTPAAAAFLVGLLPREKWYGYGIHHRSQSSGM
ncbi:MAG: hypothetical protein M1483_04040 [Actinobacteria bacterium]|nr:hypothetical protein [Actinomycetota bacterium]MCL6104790.1 hypothetical protein [Actinomycetota bacterium]